MSVVPDVELLADILERYLTAQSSQDPRIGCCSEPILPLIVLWLTIPSLQPKKKVKLKIKLKKPPMVKVKVKKRPVPKNAAQYNFGTMVRAGDSQPLPAERQYNMANVEVSVSSVPPPAGLDDGPRDELFQSDHVDIVAAPRRAMKREASTKKAKKLTGKSPSSIKPLKPTKKKPKKTKPLMPEPVAPVFVSDDLLDIPADLAEDVKSFRELMKKSAICDLDRELIKLDVQAAKKRRTTRERRERNERKKAASRPPPQPKIEKSRGGRSRPTRAAASRFEGEDEDDDLYGVPAPVPMMERLPRVKKSRMNHLTPVQKMCGNAIDKMLDVDKVGWFQFPVDSNLPGYTDMIKNPMDLGTIRGKLSRGEYNSFEQMQNDVELVFTNCLLFNGPDADVSILVKKIKSEWDKRCVKLLPRAADWHVKKAEPVKKQKAAKKQKRAPKKKLPPVTFDEKCELVEQISEAGEVDENFLPRIVQILAEHHGVAEDDEELELDVEVLPDTVLRKLMAEVRTWRLSQGLAVKPLPSDEPVEPKPKKAKKKTSKKKKPRYEPVQETQPLGREEMLRLAEETRRNTEKQLNSFKDELKRLSGKVVQHDHNVEDDYRGQLPAALAAIPTVVDTTTATPKAVADDDDEDTFSSGEEDKAPAPLVIENSEGWKVEASTVVAPVAEAGDAGPRDEMWQKYQAKIQQKKELDEAEVAHKERLRLELEAKEQEQRELDTKRRAEVEEAEKKRLEEEKAQKEELIRKREEEREQQRLKREAEEQTVVVDEMAFIGGGGYDDMMDLGADMDLGELRSAKVEEDSHADNN